MSRPENRRILLRRLIVRSPPSARRAWPVSASGPTSGLFERSDSASDTVARDRYAVGFVVGRSQLLEVKRGKPSRGYSSVG